MKVHKLIDGSQLEQHTLDGWEFVMHVSSQVQSCGDYVASYWDSNRNVNVPARQENRVVLEVPMFVVARSIEVAKEEARAQSELRDLRGRAEDAERKMDDSDRRLVEETKLREKAEARAKLETESTEKAWRSSENEREKNRRLEGDLGKLRAEIGAARCREILGH
jgi:hypothetical protein